MGRAARENHTKEPMAEPLSVVLGTRGEATRGPVRGRAKPKLTPQRGEAKPRTRDSQLGGSPTLPHCLPQAPGPAGAPV